MCRRCAGRSRIAERGLGVAVGAQRVGGIDAHTCSFDAVELGIINRRRGKSQRGVRGRVVGGFCIWLVVRPVAPVVRCQRRPRGREVTVSQFARSSHYCRSCRPAHPRAAAPRRPRKIAQCCRSWCGSRPGRRHRLCSSPRRSHNKVAAVAADQPANPHVPAADRPCRNRQLDKTACSSRPARRNRRRSRSPSRLHRTARWRRACWRRRRRYRCRRYHSGGIGSRDRPLAGADQRAGVYRAAHVDAKRRCRWMSRSTYSPTSAVGGGGRLIAYWATAVPWPSNSAPGVNGGALPYRDRSRRRPQRGIFAAMAARLGPRSILPASV